MKVFWSWQSDTDGNTSRHFVRKCLAAAIQELKQAEDIEEPTERETREKLHLDHDRKDVAGSPDLAPAILKKIDGASVFVCDVTLVAQNEVTERDDKTRIKRLINSNVAIEYGYALHDLTDERILMVQNVHYGEREELPFDLRHKAGPIQYRLAPGASGAEIKKAAADLTGILAKALRPYIKMGSADADKEPFERTPSTRTPAVFASRGEVLARYGESGGRLLFDRDDADRQEYSFDESTAFYMRLSPTKALSELLSVTRLEDLMNRREVLVPTRSARPALIDLNRYGVIGYEPHGTSSTPLGFTQVFRNGEIWGVTREFITHYEKGDLIQMPNVENIFRQTIDNWCSVAGRLGIAFPVEAELGGVGIAGCRLPLDRQGKVTKPIRQENCILRRIIQDTEAAASVVIAFRNELWDLAGAAF